MNLDLWLCEDAEGVAIWVSENDVSLPVLGITCHRITRGTRAHSIAGQIFRQLERLRQHTP